MLEVKVEITPPRDFVVFHVMVARATPRAARARRDEGPVICITAGHGPSSTRRKETEPVEPSCKYGRDVTGAIRDDANSHAKGNSVERRFADALLQSVSEVLTYNGEIDIQGKSKEEILRATAQFIHDSPRFFEEWMLSPSHQDELLSEARRFAAKGSLDLAIMMFATWIEHQLNYMLMTAARGRGFTLKESGQMIRSLNLSQKTGATWRLLFGENFDIATAKMIGEVAGRRNAFVHYKWPEARVDDGPPDRDGLPSLIIVAERVVESLGEIYRGLFLHSPGGVPATTERQL